MRIPDLNVSQSVSQRIRELDLERFKLDKQITTGQKISLPEDGRLTMSRTIQLDSQKNKLSVPKKCLLCYRFINTGNNIWRNSEINQRAQEVSRLAGSGLNGSAVEAYGIRNRSIN